MYHLDEIEAWLRGVLADDERIAREVAADLTAHGYRTTMVYDIRVQAGDTTTIRHLPVYEPDRVLADIAAKRAILDLRNSPGADHHDPYGWAADEAVQHLAAAYADRAGYRDEWRPA